MQEYIIIIGKINIIKYKMCLAINTIPRQISAFSICLILISYLCFPDLTKAEDITILQPVAVDLIIPLVMPLSEQITTNNCINDIENIFVEGKFGYRRRTNGQTEEGPTGRLRIHLRENERVPPNSLRVTGAGGLYSHVESIVRVPGNGQGSWLVMGRLRPSPGAPFYVMEIGSTPQDHHGERFVPFNLDIENYYDAFIANPDLIDRTRAYVEIATTEHIGGMQAIGNLVAIPITCAEGQSCSGPSIQFWDFTIPTNPLLIHRLNLSPAYQSAHWVATSYLADGRMLVIVNRADNGSTSQFVSVSPGPVNSSTKWKSTPLFDISVPGWHDHKKGPTYQNVNFVHGCKNKQLYLLAMMGKKGSNFTLPGWKGDNKIDLFKVKLSRKHNTPITLNYISSATFERFGDYCQMRGGSSLYVTPSNQAIIYCSASQSNAGKIKVSEITSVNTN